jgi:hypothetical protein
MVRSLVIAEFIWLLACTKLYDILTLPRMELMSSNCSIQIVMLSGDGCQFCHREEAMISIILKPHFERP